MSKKRWTTGLFTLCILFVLGGCGKNIPAIDPAVLESKVSVLIISKEHISDAAKSTLQNTWISWRDSHHIAFEWMADTAVLKEPQITALKTRPYTYIIVIGNELTRQVAPIASTLPDKRWVLLDDTVSVDNPPVTDKHIVWKQTGQGFMDKQWDEWVKQQQILGKSIEWVTVGARPIPSLWAPSEEAETIGISDAEGWFPQFQNQVRRHGPSWIAVYSPLDASTLQRVKNLKVPVIDMTAVSIELQWSTLLSSILQSIETRTWVNGNQEYTSQEIQIIKP
ncbi:hypothetical protein [Paenibacillus periandrae]|uniref:hypothetical protein n=1 Tax=Paenibacillus periandrae TaxID=1761741 RepID=UPI001F09FD3C|nr:hypothetical protein [Paenibacillus periandrae]